MERYRQPPQPPERVMPHPATRMGMPPGYGEPNYNNPGFDDRNPPTAPHRAVLSSGDTILAYTTLALVLVGLVSVFTASAVQADMETGNALSVAIKQLIFAVLGGVFLLFTYRFPFENWRKYARISGAISIGLLFLTMLIGTTANGSERWIMLPMGVQFQPSDIAKVAAIFLMAQATSQVRLFSQNMIINIFMVVVMTALILKQPNLSVCMIISLLTLSMLWIAGIGSWLFSLIVAGGSVGVAKIIASNPYQMERVSGWIEPWKDAQDTGYNLIQSYYAIGSGGLFGVGLGNSVQKLYYLPFQHTDFIFSVICEEWGFLGAAIVIGLFAVLAWRGFSISWECPNRFGKMLAFGLTMAILLQASLNVSVTIGLMPVTGVTLPLISYGGTSLVVTLGMIGILLNISRYSNRIAAANTAPEGY
jgi:cell division protein FtsW